MKYINFFAYLISLIILILIFIFVLINQNIFGLKKKIYKIYPNIELRKSVFNKKSIMHHINNDYNVKFLPKTQFEDLSFETRKIKFSNEYYSKLNENKTISYKKYGTFYINIFNKDLIITDYLGSIYKIKNLNTYLKKKDDLRPKLIHKNLNVDRVFDTLIHKDEIFISYSRREDNCNLIGVISANLNRKKLDFKTFFKSKKCNDYASPGRMQFFKYKEQRGLLLSISEGSYNKPGKNIQNKESIFGKIIFLPFEKPNYSIISMGHRVIQGLYSRNDLIIATEHGPRGGDEINRILDGGNYGWPIASYGEKYNFKYKKNKIEFKKDHYTNNFNDPIFSFVEGIGISEIIKLPKEFSIFYSDHFLLSSLNGNSIYLIKFNNNYEKILTLEKIFIGFRIRDLDYLQNDNLILMALEEKGQLGIIKKNF